MTAAIALELAAPVNRNWYPRRTEPVRGVLLHYDQSASDTGAIAWLEDDARAKVNYHLLVLDDGRTIHTAPLDVAPWHAGQCRSSDVRLAYRSANHGLYGLAVAARDGEVATPAQFRSVALLCRWLFWRHEWDLAETWRIVGHDTEAWPRGRKIDPTGSHPATPVLSVADVRAALATTPLVGIP